MSDNKSYTGKQDRIRVDSNDPSEVEYLHSQYPGLRMNKLGKPLNGQVPIGMITYYLGI